MYQIETKQHLNGNLFAFDQNSDKLRKQSGKLKFDRNTLYGKNPKYCKTPTFGHFHGGQKICSRNQSAEKILKKNFDQKNFKKF